ncbi:uncharacterized protein M437DRAFT_66945 [Aureobasidium melanogenum CBS 110374]|uniref:RING-type domain-containing protein n=1 Tax=Aureobasidium melanogenum (strain CBS 110374) TaxID=1043003 RepID=A0A074VMP8_AURM1|nr:uncharacterized protein M437DRAFT_66945 [Aureobasidium melanogenum CBS 110374]KEQ62005.1 hypothetical protein M437DRAFT_66945 [Aureobasidium melanogenum CBS 110374]
MPRIFWTLLLATGLAAPLFKYPIYAFVVFTFTILWRHLFPSPKPDPEVLLLPTKNPYLAALKPLENPEAVEGDHCPTCWDELDATKLPTKLACGHVFCNEDILEWIKSGKNTCPVCKKVLFQQAMFQGEDAIAEKVHKARICLVVINLLITLLRQISGYMLRHQGSGIDWTWQLLNPIYYLTGYGSTFSTNMAVVSTVANIIQLGVAYNGFRKFGPEWFRQFGINLVFWSGTLYCTALNLWQDVEGLEMAGQSWKLLVVECGACGWYA